MQEAEAISVLRQLPRDGTVIVEGMRSFAEGVASAGYHVVLVGAKSDRVQCVASPLELNDQWSRLSCRNPAVVVFGSKELCDMGLALSDRSQVNANTSSFRARPWVTNLIRNMRHLLEPTALGARLPGVPAFIVGAGSSLDRNHELLTECSKRGIVIAVNGACRLPGVDVALTIESNDLRHKLGPLKHVGLRAFGMTSAPEVLAHGSGVLVPVYAGELGNLFEPLVGHRKLACSAHGGTAAVSLAERWGCDPIVLVGHDFACGENIYPECLGLGANKARQDGGIWQFSWDEQLKSQPRANPLHEQDAVVEVPGLHGGTVLTTFSLSTTRKWMQSAADGMGAERTLLNASEWGADIAGWQPVTLAEVVAGLPEIGYELRAGPGVPPEALTDWLTSNIESCADVARACEKTLKRPDEGLAALLSFLRFAPLVEAWCLPTALGAMQERRAEPMSANPYVEWRRAGQDARALASAVLAELPALVSELEDSCSSITRCRLAQ